MESMVSVAIIYRTTCRREGGQGSTRGRKGGQVATRRREGGQGATRRREGGQGPTSIQFYSQVPICTDQPL